MKRRLSLPESAPTLLASLHDSMSHRAPLTRDVLASMRLYVTMLIKAHSHRGVVMDRMTWDTSRFGSVQVGLARFVRSTELSALALRKTCRLIPCIYIRTVSPRSFLSSVGVPARGEIAGASCPIPLIALVLHLVALRLGLELATP